MSGFVRRAERKVAKLEAELASARAELARQMGLDVERAAAKAARAEKKKAERREARRTYLAEFPQMALSEATTILASICHKRGNRFNANMGEQFLAWKRVTDFAPNTNLYQKAVQFLETTGDENEPEPVPVFAKTMTGDLIPLEYHAEKDSQDLIRQLAEFAPEEFPLGSTVVFRMMDMVDEPVEKSEIFGIFRNDNKLVTYVPTLDSIHDEYFQGGHAECAIHYHFRIKPEGLAVIGLSARALQAPPITRDVTVPIIYYPQSERIRSEYSGELVPLSELENRLNDMVATREYIDYQTTVMYRLTKEAQDELRCVFMTVRRDQTQWCYDK